jgi:hypothetical protein
MKKKKELKSWIKDGKPEIIFWHNIMLVRISDAGKEFSDWLYGQTLPYVDDSSTPTDWAYYFDYLRFKNNLPIID